MPLAQIALVSQTEQLPFSGVAQISAALQKQVTRDFAPIWNIQATVDAFATINHIPQGYWPICIRDDISTNAAGIHSDSNGQPFALVEYDFDLTSLVCSHECLEMLSDPFGNRLIAADSLKSDQGRVNFLLEVCDPCQHPANGYSVNNFLVSDFYTPSYFDPVAASGIRYSFRGTITRPKEVLPGGYVSWQTPDAMWWQARFPDNGFQIIQRGKLDRPQLQSWREVIDRNTKEPLYASDTVQVQNRTYRPQALSEHRKVLYANEHANAWTKYLDKDIERVIAKSAREARGENGHKTRKKRVLPTTSA